MKREGEKRQIPRSLPRDWVEGRWGTVTRPRDPGGGGVSIKSTLLVQQGADDRLPQTTFSIYFTDG